MINHGPAPFHKSLLLSELNKSDIFVCSFDESLNQVTHTCEMDIYVRFWNVTELRVNVRFIGSTLFGHGTHQNLLKYFNGVTNELDHLKLYQILMDGSSVNLKFYNEIVQDRQENMVHSLIDIGSCSLHIVLGSFKIGAEKTGWNLKALLKGSFQILHDTPTRREDYEKVTGSSKYPLFFCATR